ncbi:hypothetical protein DWUX_824 [Desulfovibrio diazotrophicus]|nr:hypothetical protein DWUX_824 [Desulfovibrio diazotrophicus]
MSGQQGVHEGALFLIEAKMQKVRPKAGADNGGSPAQRMRRP